MRSLGTTYRGMWSGTSGAILSSLRCATRSECVLKSELRRRCVMRLPSPMNRPP